MSDHLPVYLCVQQRAGPFVKAFVTDRKCFLRRNGGGYSRRAEALRPGHEPHQRR